MKISVLGAGYVGLVTGSCLAEFGHEIVCVDIDAAKIEKLGNGIIPFYEPGLDELVFKNVKKGTLAFTTEVSRAVSSAAVVFIAVGTPARKEDGVADMAHLYGAACNIAIHLQGFTVIVIKSTAPIGSSDEVERLVREANPDADFVVVSNPEFLREGSAILDFQVPDRIVIGSEDARATKVMEDVYKPLMLDDAALVITDRRSSELTKYAANSFLAMKVTFINEIADLCEKAHANVQDVARGMGLDQRIGANFLNAGPGFGGSCFPKDTMALATVAQNFESRLRLVEVTIAVNEQRKRTIARKVVTACGGVMDVRGKKVALLGLTFKPDTDDMRDSPAIPVVRMLQDHGVNIQAFDPVGMEASKCFLSDVAYFENAYDAAQNADAVVIVTEWKEFRALDLKRLKNAMNRPILVDLRNIYARDEVEDCGFMYVDIGRYAANLQLPQQT